MPSDPDPAEDFPKPEPGPLHPNALAGFSYVWSARVFSERFYTEDEQYHVNKPGSGFACGACGSKDTVLLYEEEWGSVAGTGASYEVRCNACGKYTVYLKDD